MRYIDLRSDTVTQPTDEMREAMFRAQVGDDVYGDDPTMNELEALAAKLFDKEAALFVTSGTMGNQLAIMSWTRHGQEVILGENAHVVIHEVGAAARLSGVNLRTVNNASGTVNPEDIDRLWREDDIHVPETGLVCMENALANGTVVPVEHMKAVYDKAKAYNLPVHLDGARIFNAAISLGVDVKDIAAQADSINICISKGLCAPVGAVLVGPRDFIDRARKYRKMLGGGMRQCGFLAAAGIIALTKMPEHLKTDHENAQYLADRLIELGCVVDKSRVQINMVFFRVDKEGFNTEDFVAYLLENGVKANGYLDEGCLRFVTNHGVNKDDIDRVIDLMRAYLQ